MVLRVSSLPVCTHFLESPNKFWNSQVPVTYLLQTGCFSALLKYKYRSGGQCRDGGLANQSKYNY